MALRDYFSQSLEDIKTAAGVAAATIGTGLGLLIDLIPEDVGKASTVVGMMLSTVLIYTHWRRGRIDYRRAELEIKIMERQERERLEDRRRKGLPDLYAKSEGGHASAGPFGGQREKPQGNT